jgi:hypothetical protein
MSAESSSAGIADLEVEPEPEIHHNAQSSTEVPPLRLRERVGAAQYHPTVHPMVSKASPRQSSAASLSPRYTSEGPLSPCRLRDASFKTELWREKGETRWPVAAADEARKNPSQFTRAEDPMIPLQRTNPNHQKHLVGELWTRSLRSRSLTIDRLGLHNQNVSTAAVSVMFDGRGAGFSGRTNLGKAKRTDAHGDPATDLTSKTG